MGDRIIAEPTGGAGEAVGANKPITVQDKTAGKDKQEEDKDKRNIGNGPDGGGSKEDDPELEKTEVTNTAWRYPVDTDNNGKYDSFTLYGIYFRSPTRDDVGKFNRPRSPLDARTPPMDDGSLSGACAGAKGTSAS